MELAIRLEEDVRRRPNLIVDAASGGVLGDLEEERISDKLWHILIKQVLRLFDEPSIIGDDEHVSGQFDCSFDIVEIPQLFLHGIMQNSILIN